MIKNNVNSNAATTNRQKIKHLIVDSGPFIELTDVRSLAENVYTVPEVVSELRDQNARDFFKQISFDVKLRRPSDNALREVINFSKKNGDFANLSVVDFKVMALTYMIESEINGADNLRKEPIKANSKSNEIGKDSSKSNENTNTNKHNEEDSAIDSNNISKHIKNEQDLSIDIREEETISVACVTIDYSMQNVLLQMGLNLISLEGKRIKQIKSWVLRCHACYKITTNMEKQFCPKCGGPTLIRTSTSTDANGNVKYYLKKNFQYKLRGTKYSIPNPKGGRNPNNPILCEDQKEYIDAMRNYNKKKFKNNNSKTNNSIDDVFDLDYIPNLLLGGQSNARNMSKAFVARTQPKNKKKSR